MNPTPGSTTPRSSTAGSTSPRSSGLPVARSGYAYMIVAFLEAVTWAGLLVGMYQKYVLGLEANLVPLFGSLHGFMFMAYVAVTWFASRTLGWSLRTTAFTLAAGVPPFVTIPVELWLRRSGRLAARLDTPTAG